MSNINNTLATNRASALSMNDLALKSWYSSLQISPMITSVSSKNRISPLPPPVSKNTAQEPSSPSLGHLFKKIARTPTRTLSRSSTMINHASWRKHHQNVFIYLKSPHVVASGELAGSVVVHGDTTLVHNIKSIKLDLVGLEAVNDSSKSNQKTYSFLGLKVLQLTGTEQVAPYQSVSASIADETNKVIVPFLVSLPSDLSGTYIDKKGSIQYYLKCKIEWITGKSTLQNQAVIVYSNMVLKSLKDATVLYAPVLLNSKQVWKSTQDGYVSVETSMPRSVWMSGAPIYVTVKIHNETLRDTVNDIKLELLRKQNTYSINNHDQSLVPITASCEIIVTTSLANLGWWKPLEPTSQDQVTLTIDTPVKSFQKPKAARRILFHQIVSTVSTKVSGQYLCKNIMLNDLLSHYTTVSDIPVMLVHPISMDPPPGNYTKSVTSSNTEECHLVLQEAVTKISTRSTTPASSTPSLTSSCTESDSPQSPSEINVPTSKKFTSVKKSLSKWGLQISRKMSISSGLNTHLDANRQPITEEKRAKLRISSPLICSSPTSSIHSSIYSKSSQSVQSDQANEDITKILKSKELQRQQQEIHSDKSMMKFGQIIGPKRFGQQPGCLGDAGLDIRNCFNVATAAEAIQSYAAEKVEISHSNGKEEEGNYYTFPPYLEPTQFTELTKKKAPHTEKCQIDPDMMSKSQIQRYETDNYALSDDDKLGEIQQQNYNNNSSSSSSSNYSSSKRMLASSRHLRNVQRKSVQVSKDGRALLTFGK
ncbi:hypothetical protein [Parasitella parasitica]|uniref:Arrestin C-terminal-like domain-containing protein n=1 Tax=Parasitella parasitica TaxID=35722 RepID=A0A0B7N0E8_9FUNG|nr:hypothetical protein [Parasitella parasitica]